MTEPQSPQDSAIAGKPAGDVRQLIVELRQRSVFKVGTAYGLTGWLLIEIVNNVFPVFNFPQWTMQFVILLVLMGFPLALILSWIYEATPQGIKRTVANEAGDSATPVSTGKLNRYIIAALSVLVVFLLVERVFVAGQGSEPATVDAVAAITDKSIAVLPLDDFNAGGDEAYFADGLTEEILNALTRTPDLLVASRTSSFQYKDQAVDLQDVAQALGVAHILEGSVRRSAARLRVTVQLIRASDGFHLWSENYDRTPDDIITVQEDIAFQIATALQTAMDPEALRQMVRAGTNSVAAYNAYLKGVARAAEPGGWVWRETYDAFELARQTDPDFSLAHAHAARYWQNQLQPNLLRSGVSTLEAVSTAEMLSLHEERIQRAISTAVGPDRFLFLMQQAWVNLQFRAAFSYGQQYLGTKPALQYFQNMGGDMEVMIRALVFGGEPDLALQFLHQLAAVADEGAGAAVIVNNYFNIGAFEQGRSFASEALARFPFQENLQYQSHRLLVSAGYVEEARRVMERVTGTQLTPESVQLMRLRQACAEADYATANQLAAAILGSELIGDPGWHVLHVMSRTQEAADKLRPLDREGSLFSLSAYMVYPFFDIDQYPNLKAALERGGIALPAYQPIPYACPAP